MEYRRKPLMNKTIILLTLGICCALNTFASASEVTLLPDTRVWVIENIISGPVAIGLIESDRTPTVFVEITNLADYRIDRVYISGTWIDANGRISGGFLRRINSAVPPNTSEVKQLTFDNSKGNLRHLHIPSLAIAVTKTEAKNASWSITNEEVKSALLAPNQIFEGTASLNGVIAPKVDDWFCTNCRNQAQGNCGYPLIPPNQCRYSGACTSFYHCYASGPPEYIEDCEFNCKDPEDCC
jgi:hypothetical protein